MDPSSSSQLHRPHPLAHLRQSSRKGSVVSENKNVQAAFDQLTKRQTYDATDNSHPVGSHGSSPGTSFTQRRLERGNAVPSSFSSFDWESRPHSSSVSSTDFDSSAYYGLSPFVTSSFMDTPVLERGSSSGTIRYRSLWQRYERERQNRPESDVDDMEEEEEEETGRSSSPEMMMKMSPHQVPESPKREEPKERQEDSDIELSDEEEEDDDDDGVFDLRDPASYNSIYPPREEGPSPLRPSFAKLKHLLTTYNPPQEEELPPQKQQSCDGTKSRLERPPPRQHLLQSPVFQVVNANTVKDRYLFLFNDLLIICKPIMDENIIVGDHSAKEVRYRFRPNESSLFQVKNIVELSKLTLYLSRDDQLKPSVSMAAAAPRKMHPLLASALRKFETNPDAGIAYLVEKQVLANEPLSIANFLFKTPDLCRRQLGYFLADSKNNDIYDAFLDCFRMVALRLDEALRILLMTLRLPSNWEALEYVIERFSKKWHDANQNVVKFHEDMVVKVVVAMLFLNAECWYDASSELDVFWSAREHKERRDRQRLTRRASMVDRKDERGSVAIEPLHYISALRAQKGNGLPNFDEFLERWRYYDQYMLVPVEFLRDMYNSIVNERLETGWDNDVEAGDAPEQETIITVTPHRFPTRLTKGVSSAPITISIAAPDPGLQIKLRGQDLVCNPNVLDFSHSCIQTFTVTGNTLGRTSLMFIKSGSHASRYVSPTLPRTKSIVVERPFMRYTFQIAFSHVDMRMPAVSKDDPKTPREDEEPKSPVMVKRKYIFSVETEQERAEWISRLKALSGYVHLDGATVVSNNTAVPATSEQRVGLQVLKEVLLADEFKKGTANVAALARPTATALWGNHIQAANSRLSLIDVASATTAIGSPAKDIKDGDHLWLQSPSNEKDDMVVFLDGEDDAMQNKKTAANRTSTVSKKKPNVVTKRGHEIIKLVVQNSLVPLMLGFMRGQVQ